MKDAACNSLVATEGEAIACEIEVDITVDEEEQHARR